MNGHPVYYTHALLSWESLLSDCWPEFVPTGVYWPSFLPPIGVGTLGFGGWSGRGDSGGLRWLWRTKWVGTGVLTGVGGTSTLGSLLSGFLSDSPVLIMAPLFTFVWGGSPFGTTAAATACFSSLRPFFELPLRLILLVKRTSLSSAIVVVVNILLCSPLLISSTIISLFLLHLTVAFMELTRSTKLNRMDNEAKPSMKLSIKVFSVGLEM